VDRFTQMAVAAASQAIADSAIEFEQENPVRCGVIIGTGIGGLSEIEEQHKRLMTKGPRRVSPFLVPKLMANAASGQVSILFGLKGPNYTSCSACASSNHSIGQAFRAVKYGEADVMVTGGSEAAITPLGLAGFCAAQALSTHNDDPEHASRPFDKDRDGFVMGEGSGVIVLEELERARKRGARIYAEILGFGQSGDAMHVVEPDPTGAGACIAIKAALAEGECRPDEIDYVNAHGTSTPLGDKAETAALKMAFGEAAHKLSISATKSMIGHLLGASGGAEIIATVLCIRHGVIHPTANHHEPDPACDLDYVPLLPREARIEKAISNSFGFGGHNATLLIGKLP
jgi:3-oxoacyl-[acyl-carrier-protein] synthase II